MSYPSDWNLWQTGHKASIVRAASFTDITTVNRFGARYRAAKAMLAANFDGYTPDTAAAYESLLRMTLAYSAFEYFFKVVLKTTNAKLEASVDAHTPTVGAAAKAVLDHLRANDATTAVVDFFQAVRGVLEFWHRPHVAAYIGGNPYSVARLAAAVRHGFVHGHITANMDGVPPATVAETCEALSAFLLDAMDKEFSDRLR